MSGHDFRPHGLDGATVCRGKTDHNRKKSQVESGAFSGAGEGQVSTVSSLLGLSLGPFTCLSIAQQIYPVHKVF